MVAKKYVVLGVAGLVAGGVVREARKRKSASQQSFDRFMSWLQTSPDGVAVGLRQKYGDKLQTCYKSSDLDEVVSSAERGKAYAAYHGPRNSSEEQPGDAVS
jgi:hypothetical protein